MSGQVLDSCTTGLRSFSAMSRRSAAWSRSALDSTLRSPIATMDSIGATGLIAQAPRKPAVLGPCKGRDCAAVPNCHNVPFGLGFARELAIPQHRIWTTPGKETDHADARLSAQHDICRDV